MVILVYSTRSRLPATVPSPGQNATAPDPPAAGPTSDSGRGTVPPCRVVRVFPCWTTMASRTIGVPGGREWSGFTVPRNVSQYNHTTRPSGSGIEDAQSPPVQWSPASP